jgi:hypothetical protein
MELNEAANYPGGCLDGTEAPARRVSVLPPGVRVAPRTRLVIREGRRTLGAEVMTGISHQMR